MTKKSFPVAKPVVEKTAAGSGKRVTVSEASTSKTVRETIESIVIAFVLAFLFRTFEAEAFVIPTGSMAPTLQGRHKDVVCPQCGFQYRASASNEVDESAQAQLDQNNITPDQRANFQNSLRNREVVAVTCPLCRYQLSVDPTTKEGADYPSYNGDRILVGKFPYEFSDPKRWDVVVFKYPDEAKTNFIKRLVGLPEEQIKIFHGDIFTKAYGAEEFAIERKPAEKVQAMKQIVYDNDYQAEELNAANWPARWQNILPDGKPGSGWTSSDDRQSFTTDGAGGEQHWLRYRHFTPTPADWRKLQAQQTSELAPRGQLITDFYAYNAAVQRGASGIDAQGLHWVGDLYLECELDIDSTAGQVTLDLVEGGKHFRCDFDVANGDAALSIDGLPEYHPKAPTSVRGKGKYRVAFANVDKQLLVWIDGALAPFDGPIAYPPLGNENPQSDANDLGDLAPAGVASAGVALAVRHLKLYRDIYYIADRTGAGFGRVVLTDWPNEVLYRLDREGTSEFFSDPRQWKSLDPDGNPFDLRKEVTFEMGPAQYFVLGDNSPASKDSRLWERGAHYVDRDLFIGKALYIYWPHSFGEVDVAGKHIPFPFWPNFARMGFVR